jgi:hypothetical protein
MKGPGSASLKDRWCQCASRIFLSSGTNLIEHCHCRDFADSESLITCTLLGSLSQHNVGVGSTGTRTVWSRDVKELEKVNCMRSNGTYIVIGGFSNGCKGLAEVYERKIRSTSSG